jgi:hypothetical protein
MDGTMCDERNAAATLIQKNYLRWRYRYLYQQVQGAIEVCELNGFSVEEEVWGLDPFSFKLRLEVDWFCNR